jgi:hypothetical protein
VLELERSAANHAAQSERTIVLIGVPKSLPSQNDKSALDSFESRDAYRTALPRSLLLNSLTFPEVYVNGTDGLLVERLPIANVASGCPHM